MTRTIVAMGGGGFLMEPENPRLERFLLARAREARGMAQDAPVRVCFVPTASGDSPSMLERYYDAFRQYHCNATHLAIFKPETADLRGKLLASDLIYVGGGNTKNMLALWRAWGLDAAMRDAWDAGIVLAGVSAGAICWFEQGLTDSVPGMLTALPCLGFLPGSCAPHYDGEATRRPAFERLVGDGTLPNGVAADDGVALVYEDLALTDVVSSREHASAWRIERDAATSRGIRETRVPARWLEPDA